MFFKPFIDALNRSNGWLSAILLVLHIISSHELGISQLKASQIL
jgi:hypothetical protein